MESEPSETPFMTTLGCDSREYVDRFLEPGDIELKIFYEGLIKACSTPAKDPPALTSPPTSCRSLPVFNLPSPLCSEFDPTGAAASEGIEPADAGSSRPAWDLKDSDCRGEYGSKTRQQSLEVASPANTGDLGLELQDLMLDGSLDFQRFLMDFSSPANTGDLGLKFQGLMDFASPSNTGDMGLEFQGSTDVASPANTGDLGLVIQRLMDVASPADTGDLWLLFQRYMDVVGLKALLKTDPAIPTTLGGCPPELGDPELSIVRNAVRSEPSRGNSTGAKNNACTKVPKRGHRSPNWKDEEKEAYLEVKVEAQTAVKGKDWDFISEVLKDRHAFFRSSKSCENLWGTLLKPFKVIRHHESMKHSSNWCSYWELDENGRSERQLPKSFSFKWYKMIESICAGRGKRAAGDQQWATKDPGLTSLGGAGEYSSLLRLADGLMNSQRDLPETSTSNTLTMSKQGLGPYLQSVVIDALQSALKPLATILQCEHEDKQEFDAKMKALDKKRRALDLEEIQIKRQRVGQYQRTSRSTCRPKQQAGSPVKKASVKKIIPAFKELNIAMAQERIDLHDSKELTTA